MDPEVDPKLKSVFGFDNQTKSYNLGKGMLYGRRRVRQYFGSHIFYPEPSRFQAKYNRSFFSPYSRVNVGNWRGWLRNKHWEHDEDAGTNTDKSKIIVRNIKIFDGEIEELRKSIESSGESSNDTLDEAIKLINEKNENITDLQIHRLKEGFGEYGTASINLENPDQRHQADYILHKYVIQCIIRLKYPDYEYGYDEQLNMKDFEISNEEEKALESIKNEKTDEESKIELFGKIEDMPIIPIEFAWLLDKRIVKEEDFYKLFGRRGIFEILLPNKEETKDGKTQLNFDLSRKTSYRYMSKTAYTVFLKIWTANVIAKYIFKIYHDTSFTYIKGDTYPTIETIKSEMPITSEEEQLKIINGDAKRRVLQEVDNPNASPQIQALSPPSEKPSKEVRDK